MCLSVCVCMHMYACVCVFETDIHVLVKHHGAHQDEELREDMKAWMPKISALQMAPGSL